MNVRADDSMLSRGTTFIVTLLFVTTVFVPLTQAADEIAGRNVTHTQKV